MLDYRQLNQLGTEAHGSNLSKIRQLCSSLEDSAVTCHLSNIGHPISSIKILCSDLKNSKCQDQLLDLEMYNQRI